MKASRCVEATGGSPTPACRIVQFRASESAADWAESPCNQHHSIGQQGRRVLFAPGVKIAREYPGPTRRIIQFCGRGSAEGPSSCNEDHPIGQQGRRVLLARDVKTARGSPTPVRWIVQFRAGHSAANAGSCRNQHLSVGQQGSRVKIVRDV